MKTEERAESFCRTAGRSCSAAWSRATDRYDDQHAHGHAAKGFTLIELMIVVAVISILASLLLPALQSAMQSARRVACMNNLRQVGLSVSLYGSEYGRGCFPPRVFGESTANWYGGPNGRSWDEYVVQYGGGAVDWSIDAHPPVGFRYPILRCPFDPGKGHQNRQRRSYGWNNGMNRWTDGTALVADDHRAGLPLERINPYGSGARKGHIALLLDHYAPASTGESADRTLGFNGGATGDWHSFRSNLGHPDGGKCALLDSLSVKTYTPEIFSVDALRKPVVQYEIRR